MVRQYFCDILWRWDLYLIQLMVSNLKESWKILRGK